MKLFINRLLLVSSPILCLLIYYTACINPYISGDLGKLGSIPFEKGYIAQVQRRCFCPQNLTIRQINTTDTINARIVTIGDSFSQQAQDGYQNFLANSLNERIVNLALNQHVSSLIRLYHKPFFAMENNLVIFEIGEKIFSTLMSEIDFDTVLEGSDFQERKINDLYYRFPILQGIKQLIVEKADMGKRTVLRKKMSKQFFSLLDSTLYVHETDNYEIIDSSLVKAKENVKKLHELFASKNIELIFIIAADKSTLYQDYVVPKQQRATITKKMEDLDSLYWFVNTAKILTPYLQTHKDIYYANDTHWSPVGASIVGKELEQRIKFIRKHK